MTRSRSLLGASAVAVLLSSVGSARAWDITLLGGAGNHADKTKDANAALLRAPSVPLSFTPTLDQPASAAPAQPSGQPARPPGDSAQPGAPTAPTAGAEPGAAPSESAGEEDLAKKLSNPIASLISVPFQFNYDTNMGPEHGDRAYLNVQPVIPFSLTEEWNLISRTILPIIDQENVIPGDDDQFGLGDVTQSLFFSPKAPADGWLIWGAGPVAQIPTGTDDTLSTGKVGLGPTAVALTQRGPWTIGILANHIWSVEGPKGRADVSNTFLQPFLAYTTPDAWTFTLNTESTYNWETEDWSVPFNFLVSKLVKFGHQPISIGAGTRYWAESPEGGPEGWAFRLQFTLLFPK